MYNRVMSKERKVTGWECTRRGDEGRVTRSHSGVHGVSRDCAREWCRMKLSSVEWTWNRVLGRECWPFQWRWECIIVAYLVIVLSFVSLMFDRMDWLENITES